MTTTQYNGPADVRDRDRYCPEFGRKTTRPAPIASPMNEFSFNRLQAKPTIFKPNGGFESLREQGKLSDPKTGPGENARAVMREKKYFMPGYTGFIRGQQHISGRTYGEMTRRAFDTDFDEHVQTSPVPSAPQANRKIEQKYLNDTFVSNNLSDRHNHVPGYTGHVPGVRATYSKTFGESTMQQMKKFGTTHPRPSALERKDYASTTKARGLLPIDSAPLHGTNYCRTPPAKMVPGHLKHLQFFPL